MTSNCVRRSSESSDSDLDNRKLAEKRDDGNGKSAESSPRQLPSNQSTVSSFEKLDHIALSKHCSSRTMHRATRGVHRLDSIGSEDPGLKALTSTVERLKRIPQPRKYVKEYAA